MAKKQTDDITPAQIQAETDEFHSKMERLRVRYEQYFLGIERVPPSVLRTDVVRTMRRMEQYNIRNTAQKFRLRGLIQKFHSYSSYWNRTLREIENGTYRRHQQKAERRDNKRRRQTHEELMAARSDTERQEGAKKVAAISDAAEDFLAQLGMPASAPAKPKRSIDVDYEDFDDGFDAGFGNRPDTGLNAALDVFGGGGSAPAPQRSSPLRQEQPPRRSAPPAGGRRPPPPPRAAGRPAPPPEDRKVYNEFVKARQELGMNKKSPSFEKFQRSLKKQAEQVKKTHRCRDVDFRVVIKNGKPFLKPIPKP